MNLAAGLAGSGTTGDATGDVLSGVENVIGSNYADQFTLTLGAGWNVDGGVGNDTVHLATGSGTVTAAQLSGVLTHVEDIDFTASGVAGNLTIDASFIQNMVGAGNASHLTVNLDGNDTLATSGSYVQHTGAEYYFYSDAAMVNQVAQLTVA
jgi:hypothetical protein